MMSFNIGDEVCIECMTSIGTSRINIVTDIETKYDCNTGNPYNIICCDDGSKYKEDGTCISGPSMYYLDKKYTHSEHFIDRDRTNMNILDHASEII